MAANEACAASDLQTSQAAQRRETAVGSAGTKGAGGGSGPGTHKDAAAPGSRLACSRPLPLLLRRHPCRRAAQGGGSTVVAPVCLSARLDGAAEESMVIAECNCRRTKAAGAPAAHASRRAACCAPSFGAPAPCALPLIVLR